jgi:hypothetical protein
MRKFIVKKFEVYECNVYVEAETESQKEIESQIEKGGFEYYEDPKYVGDLPGSTLQFVEEITDGIPE